MKLVLEFTNKEIREEYSAKLEANGFKISLNRYGTMFVEINHLNFCRGGYVEIIDEECNQTSIKLSDVEDFEVQKEIN